MKEHVKLLIIINNVNTISQDSSFQYDISICKILAHKITKATPHVYCNSQ